jgi:uncharacterized protein (TIGR02996 family)
VADTDPREPTFEAAIRANPDDPAAYLVYADWLQQRGAPRGELIAVHDALARLPPGPARSPIDHARAVVGIEPWRDPPAGATELLARERQLLETHQDLFLRAITKSLAGAYNRDAIQLAWHRGFIRAARLSYGGEPIDRLAPIPALLSHPSARFLRSFTLGEIFDDGYHADVIDAIATHAPPTLRYLHLGDFHIGEPEISWVNVGDLTPIARAAPQLDTLIVQGADIRFTPLDLPHLRHLELRTGGLPADTARALASSTLPALETLVVWFGSSDYGATASLDDIRPILDGCFPTIRHLALQNAEFTDDIAGVLATAEIAQLRVLDLSMGTLSDAGARSLAAARAQLAHLDRLDLDDNYLTEAGEELVVELANVTIGEQREPYDWDETQRRYAAVGE